MKINDYIKYYIQGSDHYLIPKYEFKGIFREIEKLKRKIEKLKTDNKHLNMQLDRALDDLDDEQIMNVRLIKIINSARTNLQVFLEIIKEQPRENEQWLIDILEAISNVLEI